TALRDVPEPVAGRLQRTHRPRPAARGVRPDARRPQRRRDQGLPGQALRRVRAVPAADGRRHVAAVARPAVAVAAGGPGDRAHRAHTRRPRARPGRPRSRRRRAGVVMESALSPALFLVAVALVGAALAAAVAWPLRSGSPRLWGATVVLVPLLAVGLYQLVGTPAALAPAQRAPVPTAADGSTDPAVFAAAVAQLRAELERNPDQPEGWPLLGRALAAQGDFAGARDAFAKAVELVPDNPDLLVEAAQASAQARPDNLFDDAAFAQLERAAQLQPGNQRALWFIGVAQRQRGQDAEAAKTWEPLLSQVDARTAASLRVQIAAAREAAGLPPLPEPAPRAGAGATGLRVKVSLDPDFAARVCLRGDAVVFVTARAAGGPPMPVAAERHTLQELPLDIVLDDSDSLMPTQKLSAMEAVEVSARLSAGGTADRQEGDIESATVTLRLPSSQVVELVIGSAR